MFQRIRYSSNFLVNTFSSMMQILIFWAVYYIIRAVYRVFKLKMSRGRLLNSVFRLLFELAYNFVLKTHEAVFLNVSLSILLQLTNPNFRTVFNGMGVVVAVFCMVYFFAFFYKLNQKVNKHVTKQKMAPFIDKYSPLIEDIKFENDPNNQADKYRWPFVRYPALVFVKRRVQKNYHFLGFAKKFVVSMIVVLLHGYSYTQEWLLMLLHLSMLLLTVFSRPYTWQSLNAIKTVADFLLFLFFVLLFVTDVLFNTNILNSPSGFVEESTINSFNDLGWTLISIAFLFNGLYVLKFIVNILQIVVKYKAKK